MLLITALRLVAALLVAALLVAALRCCRLIRAEVDLHELFPECHLKRQLFATAQHHYGLGLPGILQDHGNGKILGAANGCFSHRHHDISHLNTCLLRRTSGYYLGYRSAASLRSILGRNSQICPADNIGLWGLCGIIGIFRFKEVKQFLGKLTVAHDLQRYKDTNDPQQDLAEGYFFLTARSTHSYAPKK